MFNAEVSADSCLHLPTSSRLFLGHALSRWGSRMWEFAVVMLLLDVSSGSLRLVSIHGIVQSAAVALSGPFIGKLVDHTSRSTLMASAILFQNAALVGGALAGTLLTSLPRDEQLQSKPHDTWTLAGVEWISMVALNWAGVLLLVAFSVSSSIAALCRNVAIHKDWVVVLADSACGEVTSNQQQHRGSSASNHADKRSHKAEDSQSTTVEPKDKTEVRKSLVEEPLDAVGVSDNASQSHNNQFTEHEATTLLPAGTGQEAGLSCMDAECAVLHSPPGLPDPEAAHKWRKDAPSGGTPEASPTRDRTLVLGSLNSSLTRIDLFCRLAAPALAGVLMTLLSLPLVCLAVACWNAASLPLELWLARSVHSDTPLLHGTPCSWGTQLDTCQCGGAPCKDLEEETSQQSLLQSSSEESHTVQVGEEDGSCPQKNPEEKAGAGFGPFSSADGVEDRVENQRLVEGLHKVAPLESEVHEEPSAHSCRAGVPLGVFMQLLEATRSLWTVAKNLAWTYLKQPSLLPGLALAMLYLNVMSFGDVMTAYLREEGIPVLLLGTLSAVAAVTGLLGTFLFPVLLRRHGLNATASIASVAQWSCLLPSALAALFARGAFPVSPWVLMGSVIASRVGLWMFDMAALQLVQESVAPQERGQVGGMQEMLQQAFQILSFLMCVVVHETLRFWIPVLISFIAVSVSCSLVHWHTRSS